MTRCTSSYRVTNKSGMIGFEKKREKKVVGVGGREGTEGKVCVLSWPKPAPQGDVSISFGLSAAALFEVSWGKSKPLSHTVSCIFDQGRLYPEVRGA